nr:AAA family ATPase [Snodgrassella alvi]
MNTAQDLQNYISDRGISQSAVARGIGKSTATINQYLQGKYNGDVETLDKLAAAWLQTQQERENDTRTQLNYTYTATAQRLEEVLRLAHVEGETVVIYGQAGLGKTSALEAYVKRNPDAIMIDSDPSYSAKVLLSSMALALGVESRGSLHQLIEELIKKLKNSGRIILVDEAENLPLRALECLRRIHDKTGVGLVLAGMPRLLVNLRGSKGELKQLYSRVAFKFDLGNTIPNTELSEIINQSLMGIESETVNELVIASKGNTRRLAKLIRGVTRMAKVNNRELDANMVREFEKMLID